MLVAMCVRRGGGREEGWKERRREEGGREEGENDEERRKEKRSSSSKYADVHICTISFPANVPRGSLKIHSLAVQPNLH